MPYKQNPLVAFTTILKTPFHILKDLIQIMRMEMVGIFMFVKIACFEQMQDFLQFPADINVLDIVRLSDFHCAC